MDNVLIIIPTYNEKNNIVRLINNLLELEVNILIVDDNSPDNTAKEVNKNFKDFKKVHLLIRQKKLGLGSAYRDGFKWGLENNFDYLLEMDADFSHRINDLKKLISEKNNADLIIEVGTFGMERFWDGVEEEDCYLYMQINLQIISPILK